MRGTSDEAGVEGLVNEGPGTAALEDTLEPDSQKGWSRAALILIAQINLRKWARVSNGKVNISLAVFIRGSHHSLWGRTLKTGDCKEDRDKEQGRGNSKLYPLLSGKEENMHPEVRVLYFLW